MKELIGLLDIIGGNYIKDFTKRIVEDKDPYINGIYELCKKHKIRFLNLNSGRLHFDHEWYFVDRVHMTDEGYKLVAELINKWL